MANILNVLCESFFGATEDKSLDAIFTDPPYNASDEDVNRGEESIKGFRDRKAIATDFGEWDRGYDPTTFIRYAEQKLRPGGLLVIFCGDRTFGTYHALICGNSALGIEKSKLLHYKASISWIKERVPCRVRKFNFLSATEWVVVAIRGKDDGTKVKPLAFNWLGQRNMKNFFVGPICHAPERLYWHLANKLIVPCTNPNKCPICAERGKDDRRNHPTQKPLHAWEWLYLRLTSPGMTVYDPYAGVGSSGIAAARFKLKWVGTDISQEFADAGNLWLSGMWQTAVTSDMDILSQLSILD